MLTLIIEFKRDSKYIIIKILSIKYIKIQFLHVIFFEICILMIYLYLYSKNKEN